jgi:carbamoyltransferase
LGHRSILADPGYTNMKDLINSKVKFREEFRPFAPSVLEEKYKNIFDLNEPSPYMTVACNVKNEWRSKIPATTHINNTARVQTVNGKIDPLYHSLIKSLENLNGRPIVLNTSFNIRGQPIVETPLEAISTFAGTGIDYLIMGNYLLEK